MPFFVRATGWLPQLLVFKRKTYFEDRRAQGRRVRGAAILMSNHTSLLDFMLLLFVFPWRRLRFLVAELMYDKYPLIGLLLKTLGCIRVDRFSGSVNFLSGAMDALLRGEVVGVFPETRIVKPGETETFKPSVVYMALKSGAPIIPVYCPGGYHILRRARCVVGEKIWLRDYIDTTDPTPEQAQQLADMLRERVFGLRGLMEAADRVSQRGVVNPRWFFLDFVRLTAWPLLKLGFLPKVYYSRRNPDFRRRHLHGRMLLIANHTTPWDPALMIHTFMRKRVRILAGETLFEQSRLFGWFLRALGCIRVDRHAIDLESFNTAVDVMRAGGVVGIYPEGFLNRSGELAPFKAGVVLMALRAKAPVVPVYFEPGCRVFRRQRCIIGRPIDLRGEEGSLQRITALTQLLEDEMRALARELEERAHPGGRECRNMNTNKQEATV